MIFFPTGLRITQTEQKALRHVEADPEAWLISAIQEKHTARRSALIAEWRPRLFADESLTELPADDHELCDLIMARDDYKTRLQQDAADPTALPTSTHNRDRYAAKNRPIESSVILFPTGIEVLEADCACILAYVQDIEEWIYGALLGHINRGSKKMIAKYHPIILADPSVTTMPATEEGLINMIVARDDYKAMNN